LPSPWSLRKWPTKRYSEPIHSETESTSSALVIG
jgi:hypothetical protein